VVEQLVKAYAKNLLRLTPALLLLLIGAACSNTDLGQIDETQSERDDMPGPGVFAQDDGQPALSWSGDSDEPTAAAQQSASTSATTTTAAVTATATATAATATDKAEFEQFKAWNELRTTGQESAEYREFQQWLEYQKFKAAE
jgi:hypothetical protein